jgi:hypothetical protein
MQSLQQQLPIFPMPWVPQPAAVFTPVSAFASAPYGRALSALRHSYDAEIRSYFESRGFCAGARPEAASVARVFTKLCAMRAMKALPEEARWFELSAT